MNKTLTPKHRIHAAFYQFNLKISMKLQKKYLELFFKVVKGYKTPKMAQARLRDSFLKELSGPTDQFIQDRNAIYINFCDKKEDGSPNIINDKYKFDPKLLEEINAELKTLGDEEVELTVPGEVKNFIEESSYESEAGETTIIDEILALI